MSKQIFEQDISVNIYDRSMSPVDSPQSISQIELIFGQSVQINQYKSIRTKIEYIAIISYLQA